MEKIDSPSFYPMKINSNNALDFKFLLVALAVDPLN